MADLLSPGVQITEIDASGIVPTVSSSTACFSGNFSKGPVGTYTLITNTSELVEFYGEPTSVNYNDFFQCHNFLNYGNTLLISRACNTNGSGTAVSGLVVTAGNAEGVSTIAITGSTDDLKVKDLVSFGTDGDKFYEIISIVADTSITLDRGLEDAILASDTVNIFTVSLNAMAEAVSSTAVGEAVTNDYEYNAVNTVIENYSDYETKETSLAFVNPDSKLKFIAKNPGKWGNGLEISVSNPADFDGTKYAFDGISLDDLFDYAPVDTEVGIVVRLDDEIVETFTVDLDPSGLDSSNKSSYIEDVINRQSDYIFVKDNTMVTDVKSYLGTSVIKLVQGLDSAVGQDDIINGYSVWENPEEIDVDIIIGNESYPIAAVNLADARKDAIAFLGARYEDTVGKKATVAVSAMVTWRKTGELNVNSMFVCVGANYKYQYDYRLVA